MSLAPSVAKATPRRSTTARPLPPVLDNPQIQRSSTVLVVDRDRGRRARTLRALAGLPVTICPVGTAAEAYLEVQRTPVAAILVDGREEPAEAIELLRQVRRTQPMSVAVVIGIEHSPQALVAAVNEVGAFRVLTSESKLTDLRTTTLAALEFEQERVFHAQLDRKWVRELIGKIRESIPAGMLASLDEKGSALPFDLVMRGDRAAAGQRK
ncbi:MAG: hypothetical protein JNJ88_12135 [Planctomycetes bacterium]|nr:hypothetical protein [Planctomycetota bacterium]